MPKVPQTQSLSEILIHKEKKQKKNNKTNGQHDNLKKYANQNTKSSSKQPPDDKQIRREANYIKNIHIDESYKRLRSSGLISNDQYKAWWCGTMHKLGVNLVMDIANHCLTKRDVKRPAGLFHHMINVEVNKAADPYMPRVNT